MIPLIIAVPAVLFLATFVRSAFGFGEALVAVPLLTFFIPLQVATPVAVLASITAACIVVIQDWRKIHVRAAATLILSTLPGIPVGLYLLTHVPTAPARAVLAILIACFSTYSLLHRHRAHLDSDRYAPLFGFAAGVMGGAYGINGPSLAVYGTLRRWSPQHFRATLQGYFLPASVAGTIGFASAGLVTPTAIHDYLVAAPCIVLATFAGRAVNHRMNAHSFIRYIHIGLLAIAAVMLYQSLHH